MTKQFDTRPKLVAKKRTGLSILWLRRATDFPQLIG